MASYLLDIENADKQLKIERLHVGDNGIRTLEFGFVKGGRHMELDTDCTATLYAILPDGTKIYETCTVKNDKVIYTLKGGTDLPSLTALEGEITAELRLTFGSGEVITSPSFSIFCDAVLQDDSAIEAQESFSALTDALSKVLDLQSELDSKLDRIDAPEGNLAVFGPDGTITDGGAPSKIYVIDYNGTDAGINNALESMLSETSPFFVVIKDATYSIPAMAGLSRGTSYFIGIFRDSTSSANDLKYTVKVSASGKVTRSKEIYNVGVGGGSGGIGSTFGNKTLLLDETIDIPADVPVTSISLTMPDNVGDFDFFDIYVTKQKPTNAFISEGVMNFKLMGQHLVYYGLSKMTASYENILMRVSFPRNTVEFAVSSVGFSSNAFQPRQAWNWIREPSEAQRKDTEFLFNFGTEYSGSITVKIWGYK